MTEKKSLIPPEPAAADRAHALVSGALSGIPVAGGLISEIFGLVLVAPLESRRESWMYDIADRLHRIELSIPQRFAELPTDPTFTSVLLQATQAAYRANREEK